MQNRPYFLAALAAISLGLASIPIANQARAQTTPPNPQPPRVGPGQGNVGRPMQPMGPGMMQGGGVAMESDEACLYIVQGGQLFKIRKTDLHIMKSTPLHQPPMMGAPTRPGTQPPGSVPPGGAGDPE